MRRHALAILAVISLVGLGVFGCGYIAKFQAFFVPKTGPRYVLVETYKGCAVVAWGYTVTTIPGIRVRTGSVEAYTNFGWGLPSARYALWYFEASATPGLGSVIGCPLWCLILPCTIAPTLWLRRHRRRTARGFAVEPAAQATIELPMK